MNWLKKLSQYYFDNESPGKDYSQDTELAHDLLELYKIEYAISELERRAFSNQRLQYNHRSQHWMDSLRDRALTLAIKSVGPKMLSYGYRWIQYHCDGEGFADRLWEDSESSGEPIVNAQGQISWHTSFRYDLMPELIEKFARMNPNFVEQFCLDSMDPEMEQEGINMANWDINDKTVYVVDTLNSSGYTFEGLQDLLSSFGDFDAVVKSVFATGVFSAWRSYWGSRLQSAEKNVTSSTKRLEAALSSGNLSEILVAINLALNAQHVGGGMYTNMELSQSLMDELSNLDTESVDGWVDMITGENWKAAQRSWFLRLSLGQVNFV